MNVFKNLEKIDLSQGIYRNCVNGTIFNITCGCILMYPTGFIPDLPLLVDSKCTTLITNTLASKFSGLV